MSCWVGFGCVSVGAGFFRWVGFLMGKVRFGMVSLIATVEIFIKFGESKVWCWSKLGKIGNFKDEMRK